MKKMLIIVLCITFCVVICTTSVMANEYVPSNFISDLKPGISVKDIPSPFMMTAGTIINILQIAGTIVAIVTLLYLGIKLMLASPSQRADIKSRAVPYIVGSVMLFAIVNLLTIVYNVMSAV